MKELDHVVGEKCEFLLSTKSKLRITYIYLPSRKKAFEAIEK